MKATKTIMIVEFVLVFFCAIGFVASCIGIVKGAWYHIIIALGCLFLGLGLGEDALMLRKYLRLQDENRHRNKE